MPERTHAAVDLPQLALGHSPMLVIIRDETNFINKRLTDASEKAAKLPRETTKIRTPRKQTLAMFCFNNCLH